MIKNASDNAAPELEVLMLRGFEPTGIGRDTLGVELRVLTNNELPQLSLRVAQETTPAGQEARGARCTRVARSLGSLAARPRAGVGGNRPGGSKNLDRVDKSCSCRSQGSHGEHESSCPARSSNLTAVPFPSLT